MIVFFTFFLAWPSLSVYLDTKFSSNISSNIVNSSHAITYIIFYLVEPTNYNVLSKLTGSFYIYDSIRLLYIQINDKKWNKIPYLVHHSIALVASYNIYNDYLANETTHIYYILELSNLMLYVSYHLHKTMPYHKNLILITDFIQFVWYSYYRNIMLYSYIFSQLDTLLSLSYPIMMCVYMISLMGTYWSCLLFSKLFIKLKMVENPKEKE